MKQTPLQYQFSTSVERGGFFLRAKENDFEARFSSLPETGVIMGLVTANIDAALIMTGWNVKECVLLIEEGADLHKGGTFDCRVEIKPFWALK